MSRRHSSFRTQKERYISMIERYIAAAKWPPLKIPLSVLTVIDLVRMTEWIALVTQPYRLELSKEEDPGEKA